MPISRGEGRGLGMKVLFAFCLIFTWSWRSKGSSPSCLDNLQSILLTLAGRRTVPFFCSVLGTEKWKPDQRQLPADPIDYYKVCRVSVTVSIVLHWKSSFILSIKTTGSSNRTPKRRPDRGVDLALEKHGCFFFFTTQSAVFVWYCSLVPFTLMELSSNTRPNPWTGVVLFLT